MARLLIEHGADAAAQSEDGTTPRHRVSEEGHVDVARFLIEHRTSVAGQGMDGTIPLHWGPFQRTMLVAVVLCLVSVGVMWIWPHHGLAAK